MTRRLERPSIASVFGLLVGTIAAAEPAPDKSRYSLFAPTPRAHMREMSTDRPDKTESPYTVDAGHFQTEMDLVTYACDRYTTDGPTATACPSPWPT